MAVIAAILRAQWLSMRISTRGSAVTAAAGLAIAGSDAGRTLEHPEGL